MAISILFALVSLFVLFSAARVAVVALGAIALASFLSACAPQVSGDEAAVVADIQIQWGDYPQVVFVAPRRERASKALFFLKRLAAREEVEAEKARSLEELKAKLARIKAKAEEIEIARLHRAALKAKAPVFQSALPAEALGQNADMWAQLNKLACDRAAEHTQARKEFVANSHSYVLVCGEWVRA